MSPLVPLSRNIIQTNKIPIIVRLEGTNSKEASILLKNSSLDFIVAKNHEEAAKKAVMESKR